MDLGLAGKVALITGGSRGIGLRTARVFAAEGCRLGLFSRKQADLDAAREAFESDGVEVVTLAGDVCDPAAAARFVEACAERFGRIDILINNAIRFDFDTQGRPLVDSTDESWLQSYQGVVMPALRFIRLVVPHMRAAGGGAVVNVSSISGWLSALAGFTQYGSTKATLINLAERLAIELVHDGIRVNTVSPGSIDFPGSGWASFKDGSPEAYARFVDDSLPMGRMGTPEEVADVIAFVASVRANWINGRNIPVDGLQQATPIREERGW